MDDIVNIVLSFVSSYSQIKSMTQFQFQESIDSNDLREDLLVTLQVHRPKLDNYLDYSHNLQ